MGEGATEGQEARTEDLSAPDKVQGRGSRRAGYHLPWWGRTWGSRSNGEVGRRGGGSAVRTEGRKAGEAVNYQTRDSVERRTYRCGDLGGVDARAYRGFLGRGLSVRR